MMPVSEQNTWRRFALQYGIINPLRRADYQAVVTARAFGGGKLNDYLLRTVRSRKVTAQETNDGIANALAAFAASGSVVISHERKYVNIGKI